MIKSYPIIALKTILFLSVFFFFTNSYSQKSDFIATDSSLSLGIKLEKSTPRENSQYVIVKNKSENVKYSPYDISEYGFKDGPVYQSMNIQLDGEEKKVFLERIVLGKITLYRYVDKTHKTFFIKKDSTALIELLSDLKAFKTISNDCEYITDATHLASYNKASLSKLVTNYNTCKKKPFPFSKIGITTGINQMQIVIPSKNEYPEIEDMSFKNSTALSIGLFTDLPIQMSDFSFLAGVSFTKNGYSSNLKKNDSDIDVVINLSTLQVPVLIRYTYPSMNWRPFINAGYLVSYNFKNESNIYESTISNNVITINRPDQTQLFSDLMMGYSIGTGIQYNLNYRKTLSTEIRFSKSFGTDKTLGQSGLNLVLGFSF